jgi:integrase/recombinase XerD
MHMLQSGVDITVIALWLGHESPVTTHRYVEADPQMKERALNALQGHRVSRFDIDPRMICSASCKPSNYG